MKRRRDMRIVIAGAAILLLAVNLTAQTPSPDRRPRKAAVKELREELRAWARARIVPKLAEWKAVLDEAMTQEDLAILNDLRRQAGALRSEIRESAVGMRKAWRDEDYEALKTYRERLTESRKQLLDILDLLTPLAFEYRETLESIGAEARPHAEQWRAEGKEIWERWKAAHGQEAAKGIEWFLKRKELAAGLLDSDAKREMRIVRFMLWDGSPAVADDADMDEPELE